MGTGVGLDGLFIYFAFSVTFALFCFSVLGMF